MSSRKHVFEWFSFQAGKTPYKRLLTEAKEEKYNFVVYDPNGSSDPIPANQVEIGEDNIELAHGDSSLKISYSQLSEVQTLPRSKVINLITRSRALIWQMALFFLVPATLAISMFTFAQELSSLQPFFSSDHIEAFGWALALGAYVSYFFTVRAYYRSRETLRFQAASTTGIRTIIRQLEEASNEEEYFSKLIQVNLRNIEDYYSLIKVQTDKSYKLTQAGAIAGFGVLVVGILLSFRVGLNQPSTVLTIASGTLIEFISTIFFYIYNKTLQQLSNYHDKLIRVQDTMLALKVVQGIKNDEKLKNKTMKYLTEALTTSLTERNERDFPPLISENKTDTHSA